MSNMPWFRAYTEMVDDEKLRLLAFEDRWHYVALLCLKGQGVLDNNDPLMLRKVAVKLGVDLRTLDDVVRRLDEVGLIDAETLQPLGWDKRQMKSDSSAERVARFRAKKKQDQVDDAPAVTGNAQSNADETLLKRESNALDKDTDTDKEEEKEKTKPRARAAAPAPDFSSWPAEPSPQVVQDYLRHRREIKAPVTQTALNRLGAEAHRALAMGYSVDDFLAECMLRGWRGGKAEWLQQKQGRISGQPEFAQAGGLNRQEALEARNREIARRAAMEA